MKDVTRRLEEIEKLLDDLVDSVQREAAEGLEEDHESRKEDNKRPRGGDEVTISEEELKDILVDECTALCHAAKELDDVKVRMYIILALPMFCAKVLHEVFKSKKEDK